jgi:hypothetical protein
MKRKTSGGVAIGLSVLLCWAGFCAGGEPTSQYDAITNQTTAVTSESQCDHEGAGDATAEAGGAAPGQVKDLSFYVTCTYATQWATTPPETVCFVVNTLSYNNFAFQNHHEGLVLLAGRQRIAAINTLYDSNFADVPPGIDGEHERMEFKMSADDFRKMVHADKIDGQIGGCTFTLPADQLDSIQRFAALVRLNRPPEAAQPASTEPSTIAQALIAYHAAQDACKAKLTQKTDYLKARQAVAQAQEECDTATTDDVRAAAAAKVLAAKAVVRQLEDAAFEADPEVTAAKAALDAAQANHP